jgi:hypothetical protein
VDPKRLNWRKQAWLLKNSICLKTNPKGVTRNVSEIGENHLQGILTRHIFGGSSASEFFNSHESFHSQPSQPLAC